jgi:acid phosphatase
MRKFLRALSGFVATAVVWTSALGAAPSREPANLESLKEEIRTYVAAGKYREDVAAVAAEAQAWIEQRAAKRAPGERLAVVLDIDETTLSNWPFLLEQDFGGTDAAWDAWFAAAKAPVIEPVREVFRAARKLGVEVLFITGRRERVRAGTEANLRVVGCGDFAALVMKPNEWKGSAAVYKTAERKRLVAEGHVIIANLGDQQSDLAGGSAERTFKLPDPFYLIH